MADSVSEAEQATLSRSRMGAAPYRPKKTGSFGRGGRALGLQAAYMEDILHRAQHLPADPSEDNFLKIMNDARTAAWICVFTPQGPGF